MEVLEAYQAKALQVDKEINAVCDFILSAGDWAHYLATVPQCERGPLYGFPISIKVSGIWRQQSRVSDCMTVRNVSMLLVTTPPLDWLSTSASRPSGTAALSGL